MMDLIDRIFLTASTGTGWNDVLNDFVKEFDQTSACMFSFSETGKNDLRMNISDYLPRQGGGAFYRSFEQGGDQDDGPAYSRLPGMAPRRFHQEHAILGVSRGAPMPESSVRSTLETFGLHARSGAILNDTGPWFDGIFCQHRTDAESDILQSNPQVDFLLSVIANSIGLERILATLRIRCGATLTMLDALGIGVFLTNAKGSVISHNTEAGRTLAQADGLRIDRARKITLDDPDATSALRAMIAGANEMLHGDMAATENMLSVERPSGRFDYLVSVHPLNDATAELEPGLRCAFVSVIDPETNSRLTSEGLRLIGRLTATEDAVVTLLLQGLRPAEIAARRDVMTNTVRAQLKSIAQKLRCSTQGDIIRAAAATRVPMHKSTEQDERD